LQYLQVEESVLFEINSTTGVNSTFCSKLALLYHASIIVQLLTYYCIQSLLVVTSYFLLSCWNTFNRLTFQFRFWFCWLE